MNGIKFSISTAVTVFLAWLIYYLALPAINLTAPSFWFYIIVVGVIGTIAFYIAGAEDEIMVPTVIFGGLAALSLVILIVGSIIGTPLFNSNAYHTRLSVETTTFENEISEVDWNTVPQIDKDSSIILGNRKMGTLTNEVSQYNVMDNYTQINYGKRPVRVSPLGYAGFFKYMNNKYNGIPGYILVDGVSKEAEFVKLEKGMQYSPSAKFGKNLKRYLRRNFRGTLFGEFSFEIDDNGKPYYIVPTYTYAAGIGGAKKPTGCILVDPVTGEIFKYDLNNIPDWIDHAIDAYTAVDMIDSWGMYQNGYWNSQFGQKNVRRSTEGYNYVTIGNDVYLYTGITSVVQDESNIGFMMVNMRTGIAKYFDMASAEEYSAMDSAKGQVQHLNYNSTFPILINVKGIPTYFLSLKDAAGLVKMYAFVSVENIQLLSVTESSLGVEHGMNEYLKKLNSSEQIVTKTEVVNIETKITVQDIFTTVIEGNSYYYIIDSNNNLYIANISVGKNCLPLLKIGDDVTVSCYNIDDHYNVTSITK